MCREVRLGNQFGECGRGSILRTRVTDLIAGWRMNKGRQGLEARSHGMSSQLFETGERLICFT